LSACAQSSGEFLEAVFQASLSPSSVLRNQAVTYLEKADEIDKKTLLQRYEDRALLISHPGSRSAAASAVLNLKTNHEARVRETFNALADQDGTVVLTAMNKAPAFTAQDGAEYRRRLVVLLGSDNQQIRLQAARTLRAAQPPAQPSDEELKGAVTALFDTAPTEDVRMAAFLASPNSFEFKESYIKRKRGSFQFTSAPKGSGAC
jgi:streptomycin 6-kinase